MLSANIPSKKVPLTESEKKIAKEIAELELKQSKMYRVFTICDQEKNSVVFPNNEITSAKYSNINFLYRCFLSQIKRLPNIYFIAMILLETIPGISPFNPIPDFITLLFVLCLSVIREAFEDIQRFKADLRINSNTTVRYHNGEWQRTDWKRILVGDILRLKEGELVPADCVCLASSNDDKSFHLQTLNLDGRTTFKKRRSLDKSNDLIGNGEVCRVFGEAEFNQKNSDFNTFDGFIVLSDEVEMEVTEENFLPRGSVLKNCEWVIVLVGFTGRDCKIFHNHSLLKTKVSKVERNIDVGLAIIWGIQILLGVVIAVLAGIWYRDVGRSYVPFGGSDMNFIVAGLAGMLTFLISANQMVPLVLYFNLEIARLSLSNFIDKDELIYNSQTSIYAKAFNSTIVEELGQVQYIVADKTGTLTSGVFEFKMCMIGRELYGDSAALSDNRSSVRIPPLFVDKGAGVEFTFYDERLGFLNEGYMSENPEVGFKLYDRSTGKLIHDFKKQMDLVKEFFLAMIVCNNCEVKKDQDTQELRYRSIYPDEVAQVDAAAHLGFTLVEAGTFFKRVNILGKNMDLEVLKNIRYNSARRRSTMVVRMNGVIKLFCKGVPEVIFDLLTNADNIHGYELINSDLVKVANTKGLRTMSFGMRIVSENEYVEFERRVERAQKDKSGPESDKLISEVL